MIQCPFCHSVNEASVSNQEESLDILGGGILKVVVPVWTCSICDKSWTDYKADNAREAAIRARKDQTIDPNLQYPGKDSNFVFPEE